MSHISGDSLQSVGTPIDIYENLCSMYDFKRDLAADAFLCKHENYIGPRLDHMIAIEEITDIHIDEFGSKNKHVLRKKVNEYLTQVGQNSLERDWSDERGWQFINPEFSQMKEFSLKMSQEVEKGARFISLIPCSLGSSWYIQNVEGKSCSVRVIQGRVKFPGYKGGAGGDHLLIEWDRTIGKYCPPISIDIRKKWKNL